MGGAVKYSERALNAAFSYYENEKTVVVALLIAEQAFETGSMHMSMGSYSKAMDLFGST